MTSTEDIVNATTDGSAGSAPGFGIAAAVTSIGGAVYALTRRREN